MGTGSLLGVKRPGCGVDHTLLSSAVVKERVELYLYPPFWTFVACSKVNFTLTFTDESNGPQITEHNIAQRLSDLHIG
jgi:hypothetical protein